MYSGDNNKGDDGSVGVELLSNVSELEERGRVVEKAVSEGYFSLADALSVYKISEQEFMTYLLLKEGGKSKSKQIQFLKTLNAIVMLYHDAGNQFDAATRKILNDLEVFTKEHQHA